MLTKASKDAIIDGQQAFFEDLNKIEEKKDKEREELIMQEFKRLGDKIVAESTTMDLRVKKLEAGQSDSRFKSLLDKKLDKAEFEARILDVTDSIAYPLQKQMEMVKREIKKIDVSKALCLVIV